MQPQNITEGCLHPEAANYQWLNCYVNVVIVCRFDRFRWNHTTINLKRVWPPLDLIELSWSARAEKYWLFCINRQHSDTLFMNMIMFRLIRLWDYMALTEKWFTHCKLGWDFKYWAKSTFLCVVYGLSGLLTIDGLFLWENTWMIYWSMYNHHKRKSLQWTDEKTYLADGSYLVW